MGLIDLIIVILVVGAAWAGARTGFAIQAGLFLGLVAGLFLGAALAPHTAAWADGRTAKAMIALATVGLAASLLGGVGDAAGQWVSVRVRRLHLGEADRVLGACASAVSVLAVAWLLAGSLARLPNGDVGRRIQRSAIVRTLDGWLPPTPEVIARLGELISPRDFPPVFTDLEPAPSEPVPGPTTAEAQAAAAAAAASTVRVLASGCRSLEGSGFVAAPGLVVTNAHVVAGTTTQAVVDGAGRHRASVVAFDPDTDLAVLRVVGLAGPVLPLADEDPDRGQVGAVLGYPGDGPLTVTSAAVRNRFSATGRDIYGEGEVRRTVLELQADIRPGDSGGPFVSPEGRVEGVVFARSLSHGDIGYALAVGEVRPALRDAVVADGPASTGRCS